MVQNKPKTHPRGPAQLVHTKLNIRTTTKFGFQDHLLLKQLRKFKGDVSRYIYLDYWAGLEGLLATIVYIRLYERTVQEAVVDHDTMTQCDGVMVP